MKVRVKDVRTEEGSEELLGTRNMQPYRKLAEAVVANRDFHPSLSEIAKLPLEQRYVWRIASALKWAFADLDSLNAAADRVTLCPEDLKRLTELLELRPAQFCIFMKVLFGQEAFERMMLPAIAAGEKASMWFDPIPE